MLKKKNSHTDIGIRKRIHKVRVIFLDKELVCVSGYKQTNSDKRNHCAFREHETYQVTLHRWTVNNMNKSLKNNKSIAIAKKADCSAYKCSIAAEPNCQLITVQQSLTRDLSCVLNTSLQPHAMQHGLTTHWPQNGPRIFDSL